MKYNEIDPKKGLLCANVIVSYAGIIQDNYLVVGKDDEDTAYKAEGLFQRKIEELAEKGSITEEDVEVWKDEGCAELPNTDYIIFLTWPTVEDGRE